MIYAQAIIVAVVAAVGFTGGFSIATQRKNSEISELREAFDKHRMAATENAMRWEAQQRIEEGRRIKTIMEVTDAAHLQAAQARSDAEHLDRVAGVLRNALIAAYTSNPTGASSDTTTASSSTTTTGPGLVFPDVLRWADSTLRELASAYDQARIAGILCERSYGALISGQ